MSSTPNHPPEYPLLPNWGRKEFWSLEEITMAQNMDCEGKSPEEIALAVGHTVPDTLRILDPEAPRPRRRVPTVTAGHARTKAYYG